MEIVKLEDLEVNETYIMQTAEEYHDDEISPIEQPVFVNKRKMYRETELVKIIRIELPFYIIQDVERGRRFFTKLNNSVTFYKPSKDFVKATKSKRECC